MSSTAMSTQQAARGAGQEPCFPVEAAVGARWRLQVAPHLLEGGLKPEIEPGRAHPGRGEGGGLVLVQF